MTAISENRAPESLTADASSASAEPRRTLLSGDIRAIQEYIFASPRLLEMRGGSRWIDFFDRAVVGEVVAEHGGEVISAGGGNFLAEFRDASKDGAPIEPPEDRARECAEALRAAFFDLTSGHPIEIVDHTSRQGFREAREALQRKMLRAKASSGVHRQLASMPYLKRCESCGQEHGDREDQLQGLAPQWVGPACYRKRTMSRHLEKARKEGFRATMPYFHLASHSYVEVEAPLQTEGLALQEETPKDFLALTRGDDLGVLVADGNNLGGWFEALGRDKYRELSHQVDHTLRRAVDAAAGQVFQAKWRLQVLICGGDDLVVALPGKVALAFTRHLLQSFRVEHPEEPRRVAGMSGGLVFCRPGFPFTQAHHLAEELCRRAKQRCRDGPGGAESLLAALAFHHVLGSHVQGLEEELRAFRREDPAAGRSWSYGGAGPYTLEELADLERLRDRLAEVSPSQRGLLRQILAPRQEGPGTPLDPAWGVPLRVVRELRRWLVRQEGEPPFEVPEAADPRLVRIEEPDDDSPLRRSSLILADALYLCSEGS